MTEKIYSAAKAVTLRKNETLQESWEFFSHMFEPMFDRRGNSNFTWRHRWEAEPKSYIYGGFPLYEKVKSGGNDSILGVGDVFKTETSNKVPLFVKIISWNPHHSFSFIEYFWPKHKGTPGTPDRTDFYFREHPEGTIVEIIRREKCDLKHLKTGLFDFSHRKMRKRSPSWAAARFGGIVGSNFCDYLKNGESIIVGEFSITRVDELRTNFSEVP